MVENQQTNKSPTGAGGGFRGLALNTSTLQHYNVTTLQHSNFPHHGQVSITMCHSLHPSPLTHHQMSHLSSNFQKELDRSQIICWGVSFVLIGHALGILLLLVNQISLSKNKQKLKP